MQAQRFQTLSAATSFDFCYNDYYAIQGRPGFWRKIRPNFLAPDWAVIEKATFEGEEFFFFRDEQALEELVSFTAWANPPPSDSIYEQPNIEIQEPVFRFSINITDYAKEIVKKDVRVS